MRSAPLPCSPDSDGTCADDYGQGRTRAQVEANERIAAGLFVWGLVFVVALVTWLVVTK